MNPASNAFNQTLNQAAMWVQEEDVDSEESNEHLIQVDEEDFQPDISLVSLQDVDARRGSDESDSMGALSSA